MKGTLYPWWLILVVLSPVCLQVTGQPWSLWADWICRPCRVRGVKPIGSAAIAGNSERSRVGCDAT